MRKKVLGLLLAACLAVGMIPTVGGVVQAETLEPLSAGGQCQQMVEGTNINAQNYGNSYPFWSSPVESYLVPMSDGGTMRVQAGDRIEGLLVEYYDAAHQVQVSRTKQIPEELPLFGGFYAAPDAYYVLTGQKNEEESANTEVYRITKYDKDWNRVGSDGLKDCNTTVPFDAGCARMEAYGDYLLIRTSHEMYQSDDGLNHQSNVTIQFDMRNVKITDSLTMVAYSGVGYVSHSFNQFLHIDKGSIVAVDHGDAHPRSAVLMKYSADVSSGKFTTGSCSVIDVMTFPDMDNYNDTGTSLGAFEVSASSYLIAGNSGIRDDQVGETHNVFVAAVNKDTDAVTTNWLTTFAEGDGTTSTPHMVKLSDNRFVVLWSRGQKVYYAEVDGTGRAASATYSLEGELSDCAPVVSGGNITWYTWRNDALTFYDINTSDLSSSKKTPVVAGHQFEVVKTESGISTLRCSVCGTEKQVAVYTGYYVYWNENSSTGSYSTANFSGDYHVGDVVYFMVKGTSDSTDTELNTEWTIDVSDEKKVLYTITSEDAVNGLMGYLTMLSPGTVTLSFCPRYNPDNKKTFQAVIATDPVTGIEVSPTTLNLLEGTSGQLSASVTPASADQGVTFSSSDTAVATVSGEGEVKALKAGTAVITATAADGTHTASCTVTVTAHTHTMSSLHAEVPATCTEDGTKAYYECSECHKYYSDETGSQEITDLKIPAPGHSFRDYQFDAGSASCTKDGTETAKCDRCDVTDTRPAEGTRLSHELSEWETTAEPACTTPGTRVRKCRNCDHTESEEIPATGHSWEEILDREATEEETGLKHQECEVCHEKGEETVIPKLDHTHEMSSLHEKIPATCTEAGKKAYYECSKCGKYYSEETGSLEITDLTIPALGHSYGEYTFDAGSASCTKDGTETAVCSWCGDKDTRTAEGTKLPHQLSDWTVVNPTCTEAGSRSRSCANCDYKENEKIDPLGHSWQEWVRDTEPTCTTEGSESRTCLVCGEKETRAVEALGHKWSLVMTWAEDHSSAEAIAVCGNDPAHMEDLEDVVITVKDTSTCVEAGVITYTGTVTLPDGQAASDSKTEEGKALGHSFSDYVLNSDRQSETAKCDRCDETDTRKSNITVTDKTNETVKVDVGGLDLNK
ncbi:MAG: Ig-like domain-containing protein, partial [Blautia sp.]|nr:Ig-like domain-containing protein [Blautia sp.]